MRIILQRVNKACVTVNGREVACIGKGLLLLVGIGQDDSEEELVSWARKIPEIRIFPDEADRMNRSLREVRGQVLCVSQFTLYGDCRKGRRPSFDRAASGQYAAALFGRFVELLRAEGVAVEIGVFGAHMEVGLVNDGPVTLILEHPRGK